MKKAALFFIWLGMMSSAYANNIILSNISVINNGTNTGKIIEFDISWENSWRVSSTGNYDGAWVFFKFKDNDGKWKHLNFTGTDITMPGGVSYDMGNNGSVTGIGMFVFRSSIGFGTATALNLRAGIQNYPGIFDVKGFAIEMVYIPQGSFSLGDGSWTAGANTYRDGTSANPYQVTGNGATITMGTAAGQLNQPGATGSLSGFPDGYPDFWMMKYELSQGAYRDFLNTLTYDQQSSRMSSLPSSAAGTNCFVSIPDIGLEIITPGTDPLTPAVVGCDASNNNIYNEADDGEWKVMGNMSWPDAAAYLDWAGLRPMTEMEYEKGCRGPLAAVPNEYAWGNTTLSLTPYVLVNHDQNNSTVSTASSTDGNANLGANLVSGNMRNYRGGIFANAGSSRISAGAGYYGNMELTGNVGEYTVTTASLAGRSYTGKHGDGILDTYGRANENFWPGINGNNDNNSANTTYGGTTGVTQSAGIYVRGGHNGINAGSLNIVEVSYRPNIQNPGVYSIRTIPYGIRGVRN